jgi:hypothetical protein
VATVAAGGGGAGGASVEQALISSESAAAKSAHLGGDAHQGLRIFILHRSNVAET